ncbi:MAG: 4'-phosphopantetheinyl transferase superfamily protein [SAR324 cluster bacterium]|nr:4'-phosphopantetheinyl transferase superfamily protein [SAR324 cluster bacterium]
MYASLAKAGFSIPSFDQIKTVQELLTALKLDSFSSNNSPNHASVRQAFPQKIIKPVSDSAALDTIWEQYSLQMGTLSIGMDLEMIHNFPNAVDFRTESFYQLNFSSQEISYCILQKHPVQSFAGKFASKEAILKADNSYRGMPFSQISIMNSPDGKPFFPGFLISITHTEEYAAAIAVKIS